MAKHSLAAQPLSRNDLPILAQLFEVSFDYYLNCNSPFFVDYLRALRTLVGLGFSAVLVDRSLLSIYQIYLNRFLAEGEGDFKVNQGAKRSIAQSAAEMVQTATISFYALRYPRYYQEYIEALHYTISRVTLTAAADKNAAERIISYLK